MKIRIRWRPTRGGIAATEGAPQGGAGILQVTHRRDGRCRVRYFAAPEPAPREAVERCQRAALALHALGIPSHTDEEQHIVLDLTVAEELIDRLRAAHLEGGPR